MNLDAQDIPQFIGRMVRLAPQNPGARQGAGKQFQIARLVSASGKHHAMVRPNGHRKDERIELRYVHPWARDLPAGWKDRNGQQVEDDQPEAPVAGLSGAAELNPVPAPVSPGETEPPTAKEVGEAIAVLQEESLFEAMLPEDIEGMKQIGDVADLVRWTVHEMGKLEPRRQWLMSMQDAAKLRIQNLYGELSEVLRMTRPQPVSGPRPGRRGGSVAFADLVEKLTKPSEIYSVAQLINKVIDDPTYTAAKNPAAVSQHFISFFGNNPPGWEKLSRGVYRRKS